MCRYCSDNKDYYDDDEYWSCTLCHRTLNNEVYEGMDMTVRGDKLHVFVVVPIRCGNETVHTSFEKEVQIEYCPKCGRKL